MARPTFTSFSHLKDGNNTGEVQIFTQRQCQHSGKGSLEESRHCFGLELLRI